MGPEDVGVYKKRMRLWTTATLVQATILVTGLAITEYLDADLYGTTFTVVLYFSIFVLLPLMVTTPVSIIVSIFYALKYRKSRRSP